MRISIDWLKTLLPTTASAEEISDLLSVSGLEVEHIEPWFSLGNGLKGFVVGEVLSCFPHPNADRLRITTVNVGSKNVLPIVCGAPNVATGQKVLVALVGTVISMKGKEDFVIGKAKIRGEVSEGMICAEDECGLGNSHDGIMVLPYDAQVGMPAAEYFSIQSDTVIEIGLTANRGDAASHAGVAQDLAALLKLDFQRITYDNWDNSQMKASNILVSVADVSLCERYIGLEISGVTMGDSPDFMKHRLRAIGIEPRNGVVDASNYFLHQTGQPSHAFDADKIHGHVTVRLAFSGEKMQLLDGKEIELSDMDLVISDEKGAIALAGVMGGLRTAIGAETKRIFLEVAHFNPTLVRKGAKRHNLHTDAGFRFERGIDKPNLINTARLLANHLGQHFGGAWIGLSEVYDLPFVKKSIQLNMDSFVAFAGVHITIEDAKSILQFLGFNVRANQNILEVGIPGWRNDVDLPVDLYEEVMRIYGYDRVPMSGKLQVTLGTFEGMKIRKFENRVRQYLCDQGMSEAVTNSLHPSAWYDGLDKLVHLSNPLSADMDVMRASMIPGLLESIAYNVNRKAEKVQLFEFGRTYEKTAKGFKETPTLAMVFWGNAEFESWENKAKMVGYYDVKRMVQGVLSSLGSPEKIEEVEIVKAPSAWIKVMDILGDVWCVQMVWRKYFNDRGSSLRIESAPKFPAMRRDLSLVVEKAVTFADLKQVIAGVKLPLLRESKVFDIFEGKPLETDQKAMALSFQFLKNDATLTDVEVDAMMNKLMKAFEAFGAKIRK